MDISIFMVMLGLVYYLFISVNALTYYSLQTVFKFLKIVLNLSSLYELDNFEEPQETKGLMEEKIQVTYDDVSISLGFKV